MTMNSSEVGTGLRNGRVQTRFPVGRPYDTGLGRDSGFGIEPAIDPALRTSSNLLFNKLSPDRMKRLSQFVKRVTLGKDQYLYQQDDQINYIYFPETAVVSEFQILEDGRTIEVAVIGSEGAAGIASAFNACTSANCTQICVAGTVLVIGREIFEREVMGDPRMQVVIHNYINGQIKQLSQRVVCNSFHSVEQRFCSWLLTLHKRSRRDRFKVTHEHVARVLGVHRPSITCIAQELRDKKLIDYGRARLEILNKPGLEKLACRCSAEFHTVPGVA